MKKIFVLIVVAMSLSLFIVNCGDDDKNEDITPPKISFSSNDTLIVDLEDKAAALLGVTATDDVDGDVTRSIELLTKLETIGFTTLQYAVYDAAKNKGTAERPAIVRSRKLIGRYEVTMLPKGITLPMTPFTITISEKNVTGLSIKNLHNSDNMLGGQKWNPATITLFADGPGKLKINEQGSFYVPGDEILFTTITGEALYENVDGNYIITSLSYTLIGGDGVKPQEFSSTKCDKLP